MNFENTSYLSHDEIHFQYLSLKRTLNYIVANRDKIHQFFDHKGDIVFVACGSSYWMSLSAHKSMKLYTGRRTYAVKAGDVVMSPEEYSCLYDNPIFICPSRSGLTQEILDAIDKLKIMYADAKIFTITEYIENKIVQKSDFALTLDWANEESVCQTRSFSNLYLSCLALGAIIADKDEIIHDFEAYLDNAPSLYRTHEKKTAMLADISQIGAITVLGSGRQYGVAVEGAYIVIEMAEFAANYFQLLEYRHGPIVTAGNNTAVFVCSGGNDMELFEAKMADEIRNTGAKVYAIASSPASWSDYTFNLSNNNGYEYSKEAVALHFIFVMQSFAHYFSIARGKNPDNPGNLTRYIVY